MPPPKRGLRRLPFGGAALPATAGVELPERGHWIWEEWLWEERTPSPPTPPLAEKRHLREPTRPSRVDVLGPSTEPGLRQARREGAAGAGGDASGLPGLLLARRQAGGHRAPSPLPSRPAGSGRSSSTLRGQSQSARGKRPAVVRALVSPLVPAQRWQQV